jgi:hypothetical protein
MQTKWSHVQITFMEADIKLASFPHTDAMMITTHIDKWNVTRVLVDNRTQVEILFLSTFEQMGFSKNASLTFYRMMKAILKEQMERNVFTYVDDIVVMGRKKETQLQDLDEAFDNMRRAQLKLNLEKCVFGISRGKVLGCLVSVKGIEANLEKTNAIVHMKPRGSRKDVQRLTGRIATLNRFIAKIAE